MYIRTYRIYVKDSIVKLMTMLPAIPRTYLPWMAPYVGQERLATNRVNESTRCLDTATLSSEHDHTATLASEHDVAYSREQNHRAHSIWMCDTFR